MRWADLPRNLGDTAARVAPDGTNWCLACDTTILPRADARLCPGCTRKRSNYRRTRNRRNSRNQSISADAGHRPRDAATDIDIAIFTREYAEFDDWIAGLADTTEGIGDHDLQYAAEAVVANYYHLRERIVHIFAAHDIHGI